MATDADSIVYVDRHGNDAELYVPEGADGPEYAEQCGMCRCVACGEWCDPVRRVGPQSYYCYRCEREDRIFRVYSILLRGRASGRTSKELATEIVDALT